MFCDHSYYHHFYSIHFLLLLWVVGDFGSMSLKLKLDSFAIWKNKIYFVHVAGCCQAHGHGRSVKEWIYLVVGSDSRDGYHRRLAASENTRIIELAGSVLEDLILTQQRQWAWFCVLSYSAVMLVLVGLCSTSILSLKCHLFEYLFSLTRCCVVFLQSISAE